MYKTITVKGTESRLPVSEKSHSSLIREAIEIINAENGKISYMHTTEIPLFYSYGAGLEYSEVKLITVIVYDTD